jgi:hypothetical protein
MGGDLAGSAGRCRPSGQPCAVQDIELADTLAFQFRAAVRANLKRILARSDGIQQNIDEAERRGWPTLMFAIAVIVFSYLAIGEHMKVRMQ